MQNFEVTAFCYFPLLLRNCTPPACSLHSNHTHRQWYMYACVHDRSCVLPPPTSPGKTPDLIRLVQPPAVSCVRSLPDCLTWFIHKLHGGLPCEFFILSFQREA